MDGNGYPDIVVGAYQNATAMYYRQVEYRFLKENKPILNDGHIDASKRQD